MSLSAVIIFLSIDKSKFASIINESSKNDYNFKPLKFINFMPVAMILCTITDFIIHNDFIYGMIVFLITHIFYLIAYSRIIDMRLKTLFGSNNRKTHLGITLIWLIVIGLVYFGFIYNPDDFVTLLVIPYILILLTMMLVTYFGLFYKKRSLLFRLSLVVGSTLFVISDTILAVNKFSTAISESKYIIGDTYLGALLFLQFAVLYLKKK